MNPELGRPRPKVRGSLVAALGEYQTEGRRNELDPDRLLHDDAFAAYLGQLDENARSDVSRDDGIVPMMSLRSTTADTYLGSLDIRHWLTSALLEYGGRADTRVRDRLRYWITTA